MRRLLILLFVIALMSCEAIPFAPSGPEDTSVVLDELTRAAGGEHTDKTDVKADFPEPEPYEEHEEFVPTPEPVKVMRWVLVDVKLNPEKEPTHWEPPPGRGDGSSEDWSVSPSNIEHHSVSWDNKIFYHDWTYNFKFTSPPATMKEGDKITLIAGVSSSGKFENSNPGDAFEYRAEGLSLKGETHLGVSAKGPKPKDIESSFIAPKVRKGSQIKLYAFLWNCGPCYVHYIYEGQELVTSTGGQPGKGRSCTYDSDCKAYCKGSGVAVRPWCNARTNRCEDGFETDCKAMDAPHYCSDGACVYRGK
ncbi:MAG: hypothetical protein ACE5FT_01920 [Candidatus Nanoarchaeia archaeon]